MNNEWKTIDSAPKDGTPMLLFARLAGHNIATNAKYAPTIQVGAYRTDLEIWTGSAYCAQREIEIEPISWMSLPPFPGSAPASAQDDAKDDPIGTLSRDADETIRFTPAREFHVKDGMPVFSAPAAGDALGDPALQKLFGKAITGALGFGAQGVNPPPADHWLESFWNMARADAALAAGLALLDHQLLRDILGYVEDAGPADVWGAAQSWMALRDAVIAQ